MAADDGITRRDFLRSAAATGAGLMLPRGALAQRQAGSARRPGGELRLGIIGAGTQGRTLMAACFLIPGVRFAAVCDIWEYHRELTAYRLKHKKQPVNVYEDYREMLAREPDLDAAIVATPDWMHDVHTLACLEAGMHVYCEKEMSNTRGGARRIVEAARQHDLKVQIGHQRRSNPRYLHMLDYIRSKHALGRITHVKGHWNRSQRLDRELPKAHPIAPETLKQYGYDTTERFLNWRRYRKFSGGPIADLGSHQVDVFHWFLDAHPESVVATGGLDYYDQGEWYDNVNALYQWRTDQSGVRHTVRGFYQVLNTTSHGRYSETFMGDAGSVEISEDARRGFLRRETRVETAPWEQRLAELQSEAEAAAQSADRAERDAFALNAAPSPGGVGRYYPIPTPKGFTPKPVHQWHLENFFDAIRGKATLNCPPEVGYATAVSVLRVNEAVAEGKPIRFSPEEFRA